MKIPLKLKGENYKCKLIKHPEIVRGQKGKYFFINLYQANHKKILKFPKGHYTISSIDRYGNALAEFGEEILQILAESKFREGYKVFVKGSADNLGNNTFLSKFDEKYKYEEVCYYPKYGKTTHLFEAKERCQEIEEPITNSDLPNLRAAFIREKFDNFYSATIETPNILEGSVTLDISEINRNATLILFLPDNFFKN